MDLVNEYLRVVAALLPRAQRDDIVAELRDTILTRIEAREGDLGRPLNDDEVEAVLREVGHPVVVAARYREGPQHVVGPTLYPYWLFALKAAVAIQVAVALVVVILRTLASGDFSESLGRAIGSGITGVLVLIGAATCVAWFIERRGTHIDYLDRWRVRDLRMLEIAAWDFDTLRDWVGARQSPRGPHHRRRGPASPVTPPMPPAPWHPALTLVARGLSFIALGTVLVLWWTGVVPLDLGLDATDWATLAVAPGALSDVDWMALRALLFWPVLAYAVAFIAQGAITLAYPHAVRLQGLLEAARGAALLGFCVWLWTVSPLADAVAVMSGPEFIERMAMFGQAPPLPLEPIATLVVLSMALTACARIGRGLWSLAFGGPPVYLAAPPPLGVSNSAR